MPQMVCTYLVLVGPLAMPPATPSGKTAQQVTLGNNTIPGVQTTHEIVRTLRRTVKRPKTVETLSYEQVATLVQCNIAQAKPGKVLVYQMITDAPARVLKLLHGEKEVRPPPPAAKFNLSRGSTRLVSEKKIARECPTLWPLTDPAQSALLAAMLDFAYWPAKRIEARHAWQRTLTSESFEGTQTLQFIDLVELEGQTVARIAIKIDGKFIGPLEREFVFGEAEGLIYWSRLERTLSRMEGLASYQRRRGPAVEDYDLKLEAVLRKSQQLAEKDQERVKEQMTAFVAAMQAHEAGEVKDAMSACKDFRKSWPDAVWLPAVAELERRLTPDTSGADRMSTAQLKEAIVRTVVTYEAARTNLDSDLLETTMLTMSDVARDYGATLAKLCRDQDEIVRGNAAFALAFGRRPQDLVAVQKCAKDSSAKVRALALTGLGAAGNTHVRAEVLLDAMEDPEPGVRRRALQAVATCVPRENAMVARLVERIDRLMVHDKHDGVRADAVAAMVAIGAPADIPLLEKALQHELNTGIREQLHTAIETLRRRT
jgi:hypothetical protein